MNLAIPGSEATFNNSNNSKRIFRYALTITPTFDPKQKTDDDVKDQFYDFLARNPAVVYDGEIAFELKKNKTVHLHTLIESSYPLRYSIVNRDHPGWQFYLRQLKTARDVTEWTSYAFKQQKYVYIDEHPVAFNPRVDDHYWSNQAGYAFILHKEDLNGEPQPHTRVWLD